MFNWNKFPYTNFHELNLDWFIRKFQEIFDQWASLYQTMIEWKADTDQDLSDWKRDTLAALDQWEDDLIDALDLWKQTTGQDITDWEDGVIRDLNSWKSTFEDDYEALATRVQAIVSDVEDMVENLADPFSTSTAYVVGDYVVQNGILYRFTTDHPAGAWTGSDAQQVTAMREIDDLAADDYYNQVFTNSGVLQLTADMFENGIWYRGNKQANANRGRMKRLIPVKKGMRVNITVSDFDVFWGIASTRPWTNYAQGGNTGTWISTVGTSSVTVSADGWLVIMIKNHGADTTPVDCSSFSQDINVETFLEKTYLRTDTAFLPRGLLANGTDLNTLRNPGTYILQSGRTYSNSPIPSGLGGLLMIFKGSDNSFSEVVHTIAAPAYIAEYQRSLTLATTNPTFSSWVRMNGQFTLFSTNDTTDRSAEVAAALDALGTVKLGPGKFYLGNLTLAAGSELSGSGPATEVYSVSTNFSSLFDMNDRCSIHDMTLIGDENNARTDTPDQRDGIHFVGTYVYDEGGDGYERGMIYNMRIKNFSGSGIKLSHTGPDIENHCLLHNIQIEGCGIGINIDYSSEYHRITNCSVQRCWWGMIDNGGNNIVTACDFSGNIVGLLMSDNPAGSSINNAHGTFEGCTFNHSRSAGGTPNKGTAIQLYGLDYGEVFTGCQVFFGKIDVQSCKGVRFIGLNVGSEVPIALTGNSVITFTDCTFKDAPSSTDSPVTGSGNTTGTGSVIWTGCYLRDGTVFAPSL